MISLKGTVFHLSILHSQAMSTYGYGIVQTLIVDIEPDEHVKRAMNEINAGRSLISYMMIGCCIFLLLSLQKACHTNIVSLALLKSKSFPPQTSSCRIVIAPVGYMFKQYESFCF